jgi:hypothetical protein
MDPPAPPKPVASPRENRVRTLGDAPDPTSWQLVEGAAAWAAYPWSGLRNDPNATLVKENPHRQVWRLELPDGLFFAKVFADRGPRHAARRFAQGRPERIEWRASRLGRQRNVGCLAYIALLENHDRGDPTRAVLISQAVPNCRSLAEVWHAIAGMPSRRARRLALDHLVELVAEHAANAHRKGFLHGDPHPENILIQHDERGTPRAALYADLQTVRCRRRVTNRQAAMNLARFGQWFQSRTLMALRLRFLRRYLAHRNNWTDVEPRAMRAITLRAWALRTDTAARRHGRRLHAKRDRRIFRNNRHFFHAPLDGGWTGTFVLRFRRRDLSPKPSQPDRSVQEWLSWTRQTLPDLGDVQACAAAAARMNLVLCRCSGSSVAECIAWTVRDSPNRRAFREGHRRRNRDLPVASPVVLFERRRFGLVVESVLFLETINPGEP